MIYFNCGTHHASNTAFFNCTNEAGEQIGTFLIDFNTDEKFVYATKPEESKIFDISPCGTKVLTIDRTYEKRKRKTKIFDLKTKELRFETDAFFGYEAWFTPLEHLLIVRGDVKGKTGEFTHAITTRKGEATPSFADWVIYNTGEMYHLDTNAMKNLDIEKYLKM